MLDNDFSRSTVPLRARYTRYMSRDIYEICNYQLNNKHQIHDVWRGEWIIWMVARAP